MNIRSLFGILGPVLFVVGCAQSDAGITTSVKTKLMADDLVKARNINVDTKDRVVTLTGTVRSDAEEAKALQIARETNGVTSVVDNIDVMREPATAPTTGSVIEAVTDAGITAKVKARLLADPDVSGLKIDVDTSNGIVTLTGVVATTAEKMKAVDLAGKTENVTRVEDRLTVRPKSQ